MADKRAYFHVDVGYFQNPKVATLVEENPRAVILHLQAIAYCAQHLTDGLAPKRLIMQLAGVEPCSKQCGEQCIGQCDLQCTIENGLLYLPDARTIGVHDYLPDSHDWATRHADLHVQYRIDRENRKTYRAARRAAQLGGANR